MIASMAIYLGAAVAEIAGCFAFWAWLRLDRSPAWLVPGMISLAVFALLLTRIDSSFAGRAYAAYAAYAAYGGVYISSSLAWLWLVEDQASQPTGYHRRSDMPYRSRRDSLGTEARVAWSSLGSNVQQMAPEASESTWGYFMGHFWRLAAQRIDS